MTARVTPGPCWRPAPRVSRDLGRQRSEPTPEAATGWNAGPCPPPSVRLGHGRPRPGSPAPAGGTAGRGRGRAGRAEGYRCASGRRARRIFPGAPSGLPRTDRREDRTTSLRIREERPRIARGGDPDARRGGPRPGPEGPPAVAPCRRSSRAFLSRPTDTVTRPPRDARRLRTCRPSPPRDFPHRPSHHARRDDASKVRRCAYEHPKCSKACPNRDRNGDSPIGSAPMIAKP